MKKKEKKLKEKEEKEKKKKEVKLEAETTSESSRSFKPMTKEEWDKRQSVVRRVFDDDTGWRHFIRYYGPLFYVMGI